MHPKVEDIQQAFFAAMVRYYETVVYHEGELQPKFWRDNQGLFTVEVAQLSNRGTGFSFGHTVIFYRNQPVWVMQYQGWCDPPMIPFLKQALLANYRQGIFCRGRGPEKFAGEVGGQLATYLNLDKRVGREGDFIVFDGAEMISQSKVTKEFHSFQGILLFNPDQSET